MENPFESSKTPPESTRSGARSALWILALAAALERFGYFGVRSVLGLYLVDQLAGAGWDRGSASAALGWAAASGPFALILGGIVADRLIGPRRALVAGPAVMALGIGLLMAPSPAVPPLALMLMMAGSGLFRPALYAAAGGVLAGDDPRREAVFTLAWLPVNIGAFFAPLVCATLGEAVGWSAAFATAAGALVVAAVLLGASRASLEPTPRAPREGVGVAALAALALTLAVFSILKSAVAPAPPGNVAGLLSTALVLPISLLAAWVWTTLRRRGAGPSAPTVMALGMVAVAVGNAIAHGAALVGGTETSLAATLVGSSLEELGAVCIGPIALAEATRRAPTRFVATSVAIALVVTSTLPFASGAAPWIAQSLGEVGALGARAALLLPAAVLLVLARGSSRTTPSLGS